MSRDPTSVENIEWTLWCTLLCQCGRCCQVLFLDEFASLQDSPNEWAKAAAPFVQSKGWSAIGEWELLCDKCTPMCRAKSESEFKFYEKVRIQTTDTVKTQINGRIGAVLGKVEDDAGNWHYSVWIYDVKRCWDCKEEELIHSGEVDTRETFYSGDSIRVSLDGEIVD